VFGPSEKEKNSLQFRRSLYIVKDMKAGDIITKENMRAIRPGMGLATKYIDVFLGKTASRDIARGTPVSWGLIT
jgi:sialic acid synthase SpsE